MNIKRPEVKRARLYNHPAFDSPENESELSWSKSLTKSHKGKTKLFKNAENISGKNRRENAGRKALRDVNELGMAGPRKTINRPPTSVKSPNICGTSKLKCTKSLNPCAKSRKPPLAKPKLGVKVQGVSPSIWYGILSQITRIPADTQSEPLDEIEIIRDDNDDCIEILYESQSLDILSPCISPEIANNERQMAKLEQGLRIVPARPRRGESWVDKLKIRDIKNYHEKNFSLRGFVERSNDPESYFFNPRRRCSPNSTAINFLINVFPNIRENVIERMYMNANYNMSLTAYGLNKMKPSLEMPRDYCEVEAENISQLQEMQFVSNLYDSSRPIL
ncbi:uncharacterized protein LOC135168112 [Diachasmimorpha longicaudata]|uniref:uncharacterized protein LOC135168112 n=1 Tax=Diachasmimorpha longicaudata TaxID=58733 RepID=UPI0030B8FCA7